MFDKKSILQIQSDNGWNKMTSNIDYINFTNLLLLLAFNRKLFDNPIKLIILLTTFSGFANATKWLLRFIHSYQRSTECYQEYTDILKDTSSKKLPFQIKIPNGLEISVKKLTRGSINLQMKSKFKLEFGDRILVKGASGSGKTSLMLVFQGRLQGATMSLGTSEEYTSDFVELYENLQSISLTKVSIKSLCVQRKGDIFDSKLARKCLELCYIKKWSDKLTDDDDFDGKLSTGEKRRVILALLVLYPCLKFNIRVVILDEPARGIDPPIAYKILGNILNSDEFKNKIIFVVSHLEKIKSKVIFNKYITIENSEIKLF